MQEWQKPVFPANSVPSNAVLIQKNFIGKLHLIHTCYLCPYLQESLKMPFNARHMTRSNDFEFCY